MKEINLYRESPEHGHETLKVKPADVKEAVEKELKDDKWVTVEKKDGTAKTLVKADTKEPSWNKFFAKPKKEEVKSTTQPSREVIHTDEIESITSTMKAKGG